MILPDCISYLLLYDPAELHLACRILPATNDPIPDSIIISLGNYIYNKFTDTKCLSNLSGLEKWETSSVEDMKDMFFNCSKIKTFSPLSNWNIEKANIMISWKFQIIFKIKYIY